MNANSAAVVPGTRPWPKAFVPAALIVAAAAALVHGRENQLAGSRFRHDANVKVQRLGERIDASLMALLAVGAFFDATPRIDSTQFARLVRPLAGNEAAVGFDLASNPRRRAALAAAAMAATSRIDLVQGPSDQYGFLVFRLVYRGGAVLASRVERERALRGFVPGVFRVGDLVDAHRPRGAASIALTLRDDDAPVGRRKL